ncbi:GntR family transcriptional regulator [Rhodobium gokarnense]|uniref:DNA-binding GntR family transcriptional regulator n=1 Tax=Rhodobium gokarnense TaxID=364296 RepID=A0ABT3H7E1_9HYPH|nr:GntR family transcriptional regulator [Rhodobium gokarnense]MCW2306317.1 DNA-binding GntR family transcriptional regulator [Rhodobium gokarnense]
MLRPGVHREPDGPEEEVRHGHAASRAYAVIREGLLRDTWTSGTRLLEADLAAKIGVSRTPVRDALRRLVNEGFLEYAANIGCRVRGWSEDEIASLFDLRLELESYAARRAAGRIDAAGLAELNTLCDQMEAIATRALDAPNLRDDLTPLNDAFHMRITDAAANPLLAPMIASVTAAPVVLRTFRRYDADEIARSMNHHREMAAALAAGNGEWAAAVMRSHIHAGYVAMRRGGAGEAATGPGGR